jgi:hypothetical protein
MLSHGTTAAASNQLELVYTHANAIAAAAAVASGLPGHQEAAELVAFAATAAEATAGDDGTAAAAAAAAAAAEKQQEPRPALKAAPLPQELQQYSSYTYDQLRYAARSYGLKLPQRCNKATLAQALLAAGRLPPFVDGVLAPRSKRPCSQQEQQQDCKRPRRTQQQQQQDAGSKQPQQSSQHQRQPAGVRHRSEGGTSRQGAAAKAAGGAVRLRAPSKAEQQRLRIRQLAEQIVAAKMAARARGKQQGEEAAAAIAAAMQCFL